MSSEEEGVIRGFIQELLTGFEAGLRTGAETKPWAHGEQTPLPQGPVLTRSALTPRSTHKRTAPALTGAPSLARPPR